MYSVQCTVYSVQCTVHSGQLGGHNSHLWRSVWEKKKSITSSWLNAGNNLSLDSLLTFPSLHCWEPNSSQVEQWPSDPPVFTQCSLETASSPQAKRSRHLAIYLHRMRYILHGSDCSAKRHRAFKYYSVGTESRVDHHEVWIQQQTLKEKIEKCKVILK